MEKWKDDLKSFFEAQKIDKKQEGKKDAIKSDIEKFYSSKVKPAFRELKKELEKYGRDVQVAVGESYGAIEVSYQGRLELNYQVKVRKIYPYPETHYQDRSGNGIWAEGAFRLGIQKFDVYGLSKEEILQNFMREYKSRLWTLYRKSGI